MFNKILALEDGSVSKVSAMQALGPQFRIPHKATYLQSYCRKAIEAETGRFLKLTDKPVWGVGLER